MPTRRICVRAYPLPDSQATAAGSPAARSACADANPSTDREAGRNTGARTTSPATVLRPTWTRANPTTTPGALRRRRRLNERRDASVVVRRLRERIMPIAGRVVFVGAGQMATAMIGGFVGAGLLAPGQITAVDPRFRAGAAASDDVCPGVATSSSLGDSVPGAAIVFLCVKPDVVAGVLGDIAALPTPCDALVISIAAGVTLDAMQAIAPACRLVRVMPNTPCLVRSAASAFACGRLATRHDADLARTLMVWGRPARPKSSDFVVAGVGRDRRRSSRIEAGRGDGPQRVGAGVRVHDD